MRASTSPRWLSLLVLMGMAAGCNKESGTFVKLTFTGNLSQDKPLASIALALELATPQGSRTSTATFPIPSGKLDWPTTGVLEIGSGEGTLYVAASALAVDGSVLGTGTGAGTVTRGKTSQVTVTFSQTAADGGTDGPAGDTRPLAMDAGIDGRSDAAPDLALEVSLPPDLPRLDSPVADLAPDEPVADASEAGRDVALDVPGQGGAGGTGGTSTGGAGGTGTGGVGGGTGGTGSGGTTGTYLLVVTPPSIDFGIVAPGSTSPAQSFTIVNKGSAPTPALTTSIADLVHFPLVNDGCAAAVLVPTGSCVVSVAFAPTASGAIRTQGGVGPAGTTGTPSRFTLSGTGAGGAAALSLAPSPASFGIVDVNQSVPVPMTLTNGGDAGAGTVTVEVTGSPAFKLASDTCSGIVLGPLSQCTFTVTFTPTAFGPVSATVNARSSSGLSTSASAVGTGRDHVLLTIQFTGNGGGTVNGVNPPCSSGTNPCLVDIVRTDPAAVPKLDLTGQADALSVFGGWGGDCTGNGTCSVIMAEPRSVTAIFNARMVSLSLTVLGVSGVGGTLASDDGSISCGGSCPNLSHAATNSFTLNAKPAPGSSFIAWTSGPCRGTKPTCTFALTAGVAITATFGPQPAYMFVTSSTVVPGSLGGVEGGDKECQRLAAQAGLPGTYMAWLSTSGLEARKRVGDGGWMRTDGRPFARALKLLADSTLPGYPTVYYPPRVDETGNDLGNKPLLVATGGNTDGTPFGAQCVEYTKPVGDLYVGDASSGAYGWSYTQLVTGGCAQPFHLYCFRSDVSAEIVPPRQDGQGIFVTAKPFTIATSTITPNSACQKEADAAGLPNASNFVAFLATSTTPALKLLSGKGPWKRSDNVIVANQASDLGKGQLLASPNLLADGSAYLSDRFWTGAADPTVPGTASTTCSDWTRTLSTPALVGDSRTTATPNWFSLGNTGAVACGDVNTHLLCVEP